jgi:hypothetical protein
MWQKPAATLCCCLAGLPLFGCAAGPPAGWQATPATPVAVADGTAPPGLYPTGADRPAAILVLLPGAGAFGVDPALWASQGIDVVIPPQTGFGQLAAAQQDALAQMMASARRLADAPIWLLGPSPEIEAALAAPGSGRQQVSGIVVTASGPAAGICTESFSYFDPGTGAKPKVRFSKSSNCPPGSGFEIGGPSIVPAPAVRPTAPRVIEAKAAPDIASSAAQRAAVAHLAELIKAGPSS